MHEPSWQCRSQQLALARAGTESRVPVCVSPERTNFGCVRPIFRMLPVCRRVSQPAAPVDLQPLGVRPPWVHNEPSLVRVQPAGCVLPPVWLDPPSDQLARPRALLLLWHPAIQAAPGLLRGTRHSEIGNVKLRSYHMIRHKNRSYLQQSCLKPGLPECGLLTDGVPLPVHSSKTTLHCLGP